MIYFALKNNIIVSVLILIIVDVAAIFINTMLAYNMMFLLNLLIIPANVFSLFKMDDESGWSKYQLILPISNSKVVVSKYTFWGILLLVTEVLTVLITMCGNLLMLQAPTEILLNFNLRALGFSLIIAASMFVLSYYVWFRKK